MANLSNAAAMVLVAQGQQNPNNANNPNLTWFTLPLIIVMFYLLLMRPERRKRKEHERQLENLKQNDEVVTYGGIKGTIVNAAKDADYVTLRVDENNNTRLKVLRSAIMRIENEDKGKDVPKEK